jgi:hypothetical protein
MNPENAKRYLDKFISNILVKAKPICTDSFSILHLQVLPEGIDTNRK